jgi:hypothetical protein
MTAVVQVPFITQSANLKDNSQMRPRFPYFQTYLSEVSTTSMRGLFGTCGPFGVCLGVTLGVCRCHIIFYLNSLRSMSFQCTATGRWSTGGGSH